MLISKKKKIKKMIEDDWVLRRMRKRIKAHVRNVATKKWNVENKKCIADANANEEAQAAWRAATRPLSDLSDSNERS